MKTYQEFREQIAIIEGREALATAADVLVRAAAEVQSFLDRYDSAEALVDKANQCDWALHYCASSVLGNLRLDMLSKAQARLLVAHEGAKLAEAGPSPEA